MLVAFLVSMLTVVAGIWAAKKLGILS